jgi:hypothetical protein
MSYRYWLELPLVVGLFFRSFSDIIAGGMVGNMMLDSNAWPNIDRAKHEYHGTKLQDKPLFWNETFPTEAYYIYAFVLLYIAYFFGMAFHDTIANPGLVFGAVGVPPLAMEIVAYGNVFIMYLYAGKYLAEAVKGTLASR